MRSHSRKGRSLAGPTDPYSPQPRRQGPTPRLGHPLGKWVSLKKVLQSQAGKRVSRPGAADGPVLEGTRAATHQLVMPEGGSWWPWRPLGSWRSSRPDPRVPLGKR